MIPRDYITQWRERAPWSEDFQVEQDLVISRALVAVYSDPDLAEALAFRGGTALCKLYLTPPARCSEDIDLVQVKSGPAGPLMDRLRSTLDPWMGKAQWKQSQGRVTELRDTCARRVRGSRCEPTPGYSPHAPDRARLSGTQTHREESRTSPNAGLGSKPCAVGQRVALKE